MTRLARALTAVVQLLDRERQSFALVGGLAVSVRAEPRFTRDIDIAVAAPNDAAAEALVRTMLAQGYRVVQTLEQTAAGRLATVRLASPGEGSEGVVVDLLVASSGIESEIAAEAESLEVLPGITLPVARSGHLLALKLLAENERRPQDTQDIQSLLAGLGQDDAARATRAAQLIQSRGFARGRDLPALVQGALARRS